MNNIIKVAFLLIFILLSKDQQLVAQSKKNSTALTEAYPIELNQLDKNGKKTGIWFFKQEKLRGEQGYYEFGNYANGRKEGIWTKMDLMGQLLSSENFRNNNRDGEARYYEKGKLISVGHFRGLNPDKETDTIWVQDAETLIESQVVVRTDVGSLRHGLWKYYDPLYGLLIKEEEYQVDKLIKSKSSTYTSEVNQKLIEEKKAQLPHHLPPANRNTKRFKSKIK